MVMPVIVLLFRFGTVVMVMLPFTSMLTSICEIDLAPHFLKVKVSIHVILQPQDALAALVGSQDDVAPCGPLPVHLASEPTILVKTEPLILFAFNVNHPLTGQLLEERDTVVRMSKDASGKVLL